MVEKTIYLIPNIHSLLKRYFLFTTGQYDILMIWRSCTVETCTLEILLPLKLSHWPAVFFFIAAVNGVASGLDHNIILLFFLVRVSRIHIPV